MTGPSGNDNVDVLTVWSDIGCPWASLALHTLHTAAERRGQTLLLDHHAFPLELFNRQPTPKFIVDPEVIVIAACRPELGWRLWQGKESEYPVTTLPALEAVQAAKDPAVGGLAASGELDRALRRAFYAESRCISVHSVILDIAEECTHVDAGALSKALARGAGRAEVYEQWRTAQGPDVQGSPHFFTADGYAAHNPGARFEWTGDPNEGGLPRLHAYDTDWADELLDKLVAAAGRISEA
ncbi:MULTISPECIES: DsbA family oxidoreductase [Streptomyces]|uniref:DsbA family protein n=1 Tax=Streptomyces chengmaiensis TaxID=3040919 RepID=A0ABT6HLN8_9ACTN|nr:MULTISPECIES: DsbA family protein [Streptomyces]MDH2389637.1 DsbA family protein [Streptomyces chengmaiensis]WRQ82860.1 DsbA family protein [Streptomyces sp. MUM 178J]